MEEQLYNLIDDEEITNFDSEERPPSPNTLNEAFSSAMIIKESEYPDAGTEFHLKTFKKIESQKVGKFEGAFGKTAMFLT